MKAFFKDIYQYHQDYNNRLIQQLLANKQQLPKKAISLFNHTMNAQQIWNARILNLPTEGVFVEHDTIKWQMINDANFENSFKIIEEKELNEIVVYKNTKGLEYKSSVKEILFHVANHSTHHKGQIVALLRQNEIEPIITDYIFYKR